MMGNVLWWSVIRKIVNKKYQKIDIMMLLSINKNDRKIVVTKYVKTIFLFLPANAFSHEFNLNIYNVWCNINIPVIIRLKDSCNVYICHFLYPIHHHLDRHKQSVTGKILYFPNYHWQQINKEIVLNGVLELSASSK